MKYSHLIVYAVLCGVFACNGNRSSNESHKASDSEHSYSIKAEAVITGHILNKEVYPRQTSMRLKIPGYGPSYTVKESRIDENGNFSFRFFPYGSRDVALETFVSHLIIRPGDSLHLEIDFKRLLNIRFSGTAGKINKDLFAFTDKGYYIAPYSGDAHWEWSAVGFKDNLRVLRKEMEERKKAYLRNYTPDRELLDWINQTLDIDYYKVMLAYPWNHANAKKEKEYYDEKWYSGFISKVEKLYDGEIANSKLYELTSLYWIYFNLKLKQEQPDVSQMMDTRTYFERILLGVQNPVLREYLISMLFNYLIKNPAEFQKHLDFLNTYLTIPQLKYPLLEAWQIKSKNAYPLP